MRFTCSYFSVKLAILMHLRSAFIVTWFCQLLCLIARKGDQLFYMYGGWFVPFRIFLFSGRKRERSPRETPPKGNFVVFSHGDLSPRQAKIRQTVAENATHGMSCTFVWRGERSPCENTKKSPFGGFLRGAFSPRKHDNTTWHKSATTLLYISSCVDK